MQWTQEYSYLSEIVVWLPLDLYPEVELLDHMEVLVLVFRGTFILFSIKTVLIYIPTNRTQGFPFLHILATLDFFVFLIKAILASVTPTLARTPVNMKDGG